MTNRFYVCPRCDKKYFFKTYECKCGFENFIQNDSFYSFKTKKYKIVVGLALNETMIESREYKTYLYCGIKLKKPTMTVHIPRVFHPKTKEEDIEKLLLLL